MSSFKSRMAWGLKLFRGFSRPSLCIRYLFPDLSSLISPYMLGGYCPPIFIWSLNCTAWCKCPSRKTGRASPVIYNKGIFHVYVYPAALDTCCKAFWSVLAQCSYLIKVFRTDYGTCLEVLYWNRTRSKCPLASKMVQLLPGFLHQSICLI